MTKAIKNKPDHMMQKDFISTAAASARRTTSRSGLTRPMLICAVVLAASQIGSAQSAQTNSDEPRPLVSSHGSRGRLDPGEANTQAIAREMADTLAGNFEQAVMTPTRSSFLAKWKPVNGATGYRMDVSTSPSFDDYVGNYRDIDVGNATSQVVSGLAAGTDYYYRVRSYDSAATGGNSQAALATTARTNTRLVIGPTFDSTITSDPRSAAIQAMIVSTIDGYQKLFADPITVTILFRLSTVHPDCRPLERNLVAASDSPTYAIDWNAYVNALKADAKSPSDATAISTLPTNPLTARMTTRSAAGRAIGLNTAPVLYAAGHLATGGPYDGHITLNSSPPLQFTRPVAADNCDARSFTGHEIDEVLGLGSRLGGPFPEFLASEDLFSWASLNDRNSSMTGSPYCSIDQGLHLIVKFNNDPAGDYGDWDSPACPQNHPLVQNAFNCPGQSPEISATSPEGIALDVIGYDLVTYNGSNGVFGNISTRLPVGTGQNVLIAW